MVTASCHCGAVRIEVDTVPTEVTDCDCSICRRYAPLWAYYAPSAVRVVADVPTATYRWGARSLDFHRCATCGCVTHWAAVEGLRANDRMGVNARLMDADVVGAARRRRLDGARTERYLD